MACHKDNQDADDHHAPVINITTPTAMDSISGVVAIKGVVTDEGLHKMSIKVTQDSNGSILFSAEPEVHDLTTYSFTEMWTPSGIAAETAVTLTVSAEDHGANMDTSVVKFVVKP